MNTIARAHMQSTDDLAQWDVRKHEDEARTRMRARNVRAARSEKRRIKALELAQLAGNTGAPYSPVML